MTDFSTIKRFLIGKPFPNRLEVHERLDKVRGLAIFASDPISSNAYATEAIMTVLIIISTGALQMTLPIALIIASLVFFVIFSYIQTILHYPDGGGAYTVSKDNLGTIPSLIAGAALLTDYVLTVAVSVSAGVRAVSSAFPEVHTYRVAIAVGVIVFITWMNLRGVRESGTVFAVPTYAFFAGVLLTIAIGLARYFGLFGLEPLPIHTYDPAAHPAAASPIAGFAYIWLVLRAFAAGCTALTGIEAISNGIKAFKPPESINAAKTMSVMGLMAMSLFLGISFLSTRMALIPFEENSILSQMTYTITGGGFLYYWVQLFTMLILFMAANTGYQDFPRLSAFLARDDFLPRWLENRGDRLVYSMGIITLAFLSSLIVIVFQANEIKMLPLYALGVFLSFCLSQVGMFRLMGKIGKVPPGESVFTGVTTIHYESGWWWKRIINLVGATGTGIVLVILAVTKFREGAWIVVLAVPLLALMFRGINGHYRRVSEALRTRNLAPGDLQETADLVIVAIGDVHRGSLRALKYAKHLGSDVRAVSIITSEKQRQNIEERWQRFPEITEGVELVLIDYEYRDIVDPLIDYIEHVNNVEFPDQLVTVVVPQFLSHREGERFLHNQTAGRLRRALSQYADLVIIDVPYHI